MVLDLRYPSAVDPGEGRLGRLSESYVSLTHTAVGLFGSACRPWN